MNKKENMQIREVLIKLGISSHLQGFHYIIQALEILEKQQIHTKLLTIYRMIGKKNEKPYGAIERSIRHAIQTAYKNNNNLKTIYTIIPDNSAFLYDLYFNFDIFEDYFKWSDKRWIRKKQVQM